MLMERREATSRKGGSAAELKHLLNALRAVRDGNFSVQIEFEVVEIASLQSFSQTHMAFLEQLMESLGVVLNTIQAGMRTEELLKQSQDLAEELQTRQADLKRSNEELEEQARALKRSQEQLRAQREELSEANDELEDKAKKLEEQKKVVELKNDELELTRASLREKAEQLAVTSRYKSEFLANMSHELRTPLNSLLLLAGLLTENKEQNLTRRQVEYVQTIHSSGNDLLSLINEILDLAKIEAGRTEINVTAFPPAEIGVFAGRTFRQTAEQKGLSFQIEAEEDLPSMIRTDRQRLEQIVRNLLSNAFKFTEAGSVTLEIARPKPDVKFDCNTLRLTDRIVAFTVRDTGIGIPKERQKFIREAFQQVDSTTSRKFGGTGLGLSISREIAMLLGGEIHLDSDAALSSNPDVDLVMMDIMMPGMDGYETMRLIRQDERHRLLPIVCLTAKAMKGDREKCIKAGASDYVSKPVDVDRLISLLRVWLFTANKAKEP